MPKVSVIIPTMAGREALLKKLLSTIPDWCEKIVISDDDLLLAAKRNKGGRKALGEYLLFIDDDNYLAPGAIEAALKVAEGLFVGVVGFMACYDDKPDAIADGGSARNYITGFTTGLNTNKSWSELSKTPYEVDEIANAFMMHIETFYELGGFDEKNFPIDLDEADFCKRAKDYGLKILMCPEARCYHKSQTYSRIADFRRPMNAYYMGRNKVLYQKKHTKLFQFLIYLIFFLPSTIAAYFYCLMYRRKPIMFWHFIRGVFDGLRR